MERPNFRRLRDAFAILDGIPKEAFNLDSWTVQQGESLSCGTIACAGGWLARHPKFKRIGLYVDNFGDVRLKKGSTRGYGDAQAFEALSQAFSLNRDRYEDDLFSSRADGYKDQELTPGQMMCMTDKQLWKRRVLRLFQEYNEPFHSKVGEGLLLDVRRP